MSSSTKVFEQIERSSGSARQICSSNAFNVRERKFVMRDFNQEINTDGWSLEDQRVISRCSSKGWEGVGEHSSSSMLDVEPMDNFKVLSPLQFLKMLRGTDKTEAIETSLRCDLLIELTKAQVKWAGKWFQSNEEQPAPERTIRAGLNLCKIEEMYLVASV